MKLKKLLLIIGCILLIYFLVCIGVSLFANREIFYTDKWAKCRIFENGKMIVEDNEQGNTEIFLKKDEIRKLKRLIIEDKKLYSRPPALNGRNGNRCK